MNGGADGRSLVGDDDEGIGGRRRRDAGVVIADTHAGINGVGQEFDEGGFAGAGLTQQQQKRLFEEIGLGQREALRRDKC